jgi:hypothetical protein
MMDGGNGTRTWWVYMISCRAEAVLKKMSRGAKIAWATGGEIASPRPPVVQ